MKHDNTAPPVKQLLLNAGEAATYLGISKTSLNKLRREGKLPSVHLITDARYHIDDLNTFINQHRNNTGDRK
jgi:hypothetical protein